MGDVMPMNDGAWKLGFLASLDFSSWDAEDVVETDFYKVKDSAKLT